MPFEEALDAALLHVGLDDLKENPAALCMLSAKDERRQAAGLVLRKLVCEGHDDVAGEFGRVMERAGVSELAARSFWHAYEDITRKWVETSLCESVCNTAKAAKGTVPSRPVLFAIHVPRA
jgi:hypothetical protein